MKAKEPDKKFNNCEDVAKFPDMARAKRPGQEQRRVNVDFPACMIERLDKEARRLGVTRQSIIKVWIADRLQKDVPRAWSSPFPLLGTSVMLLINRKAESILGRIL